MTEATIFVPFLTAFGGVERLVLSLSKFLHENRSPHRVCCFCDAIDLASYADWPLKVEAIRAPRNPLREAWALNRLLRENRSSSGPPVLIFDLNGAFYAGLFAPAGYCLHLTDPPSLLPTDLSKWAWSSRKADVFPLERADVSVGRKLWAEAVHRINRRGVRKAATVIAMTHAIKVELECLYGVEANVIRPGVRTDSWQPARQVAANEPMRLLSVSRLESNKRLDWILDALSASESASAPFGGTVSWELDIVGSGTQEEPLKRLAHELGVSARTHFHGRVSDADLDAIYRRASIFLMPARQGYGLPALESLGRGLPVILNKDSGVSEILEGTPWAEICDGGSASLQRAILSMNARILGSEITPQTLPKVPTEAEWAQSIVAACRWG
ncbi:MAG: glycosyltransferase [Pirellulaceae bacterium]|nr:glycosyltransferase [Pirellulaceae bacterium]